MTSRLAGVAMRVTAIVASELLEREAHVLEALQREPRPGAGTDADAERGLRPAPVLVAVDDDVGAAEAPERHVVRPGGQILDAEAHRGAAVAAAPRDVHDDGAVLRPQALEQLERCGR